MQISNKQHTIFFHTIFWKFTKPRLTSPSGPIRYSILTLTYLSFPVVLIDMFVSFDPWWHLTFVPNILVGSLIFQHRRLVAIFLLFLHFKVRKWEKVNFLVEFKVKVQDHLHVKVTWSCIVDQHCICMFIVIILMAIHCFQLLHRHIAVYGNLNDLWP